MSRDLLGRSSKWECSYRTEAAKLFNITQPRVSDLMRGKINLFGIDALVNMAAAAGMYVEISLKKAA